MAVTNEQLKQVILEKGLLNEKTLDGFIDSASTQSMTLMDLLFAREALPDEVLGQIVADLYGVPFVKLKDVNFTDALLKIVPQALASYQYVMPIKKEGEKLYVALNDPKNYELVNFLEKKSKLDVIPCYATRKDILSALKVYSHDVNQKFSKLLEGALDDPTKIESLKDVSKILDTIILFAYQSNASDVHLEPHDDFFVVRYRVDGILQVIAELPVAIFELLVTRIKVLSDLRTDEHRAPQDGRFRIELEHNEITLRVSIVPTYHGEKVVLRLLSSTNQELNLEALGYSEGNLRVIHENILKTHGMILMTGPTGSGKTTTLYSVLKLLNSPEVNISTIEDPIEYKLEGVNQIQVNPEAKLTFATGLRVLLRQDPDILMVGEIRDEETGGIAINAALTGHLVFATLHTNDAASTLPRMIEMGVESFLLSATVKMIVAQRLVRRICKRCKVTYTVPFEELKAIGGKYGVSEDLESIFNEIIEKYPALKDKADGSGFVFSKGEGCDTCNGGGFSGRAPIAEVISVTESLQKMILEGASALDIEDQAKKEGMVPLFADGMMKVLQGVTTIEEVLRVMRE